MINKFCLCLLVTVCISSFLSTNVNAQSRKSNCSGFKDSLTHKFVYKSVDKIPEPVGGLDSFSKYLAKKIKFLPSSREQAGSRIVVAFVVEGNGAVDGERVVRDLALDGHSFAKQILDAVKNYKWKPGSCGGKSVPVLYFFPLTVDLAE